MGPNNKVKTLDLAVKLAKMAVLTLEAASVEVIDPEWRRWTKNLEDLGIEEQVAEQLSKSCPPSVQVVYAQREDQFEKITSQHEYGEDYLADCEALVEVELHAISELMKLINKKG